MMENNKVVASVTPESPEVPSLIKLISSSEVDGFDKMEETNFLNNGYRPNRFQPLSPATKVSFTLMFCLINIQQKRRR